jgi:hypothetical protein
VTIDTTINIGHIITIFGAICAAIGTVYLLKSDIRVFDVRLGGMEKVLGAVQAELAKVAQVTIEQALHNHQLQDLRNRIERLEQKRSYVRKDAE